jgi:hypothetical protein
MAPRHLYRMDITLTPSRMSQYLHGRNLIIWLSSSLSSSKRKLCQFIEVPAAPTITITPITTPTIRARWLSFSQVYKS